MILTPTPDQVVEALTGSATGALAELAQAAAGFDPGALAAATRSLAQVRQALERTTLVVTDRAAELCRAGQGPHPDDLLAREGQLPARDASRLGRRQRLCAAVPGLGDAFRDGVISGDHVDVVVRVGRSVDAEVRRQLFSSVDDMVHAAHSRSVHDFELWCRNQIEALHAQLGRNHHEQLRHQNRFRLWLDRVSGQYLCSGQFDPELGSRLATAVRAQTEALRNGQVAGAPGDPLGPVDELLADREHLAAHALVHLVTGTHRQRRPAEVEICVLIDADTLAAGTHTDSVCELHDGTPLPVDTVRRWACIANIRRVLVAATGEVLELGRTTRLANRAQRRALRSMYRTCAFHQCTAGFDECEIHHLVPWDPDGDTDLSNLLPLCTKHHHLVHDLGWELSLDATRTLTIHQPDHTLYATVPLPGLRPRRHTGTPPGHNHAPPGHAPPGHDPPGHDPPGLAHLARAG